MLKSERKLMHRQEVSTQAGLRRLTCVKVLPLVNSLQNNKLLEWLIFKAFADDKMNASEKLKLVLGRVENIVGKGENAGYQFIFLSPQCFQ